MMRRLLGLLGYGIEYHCAWGVYSYRYDGSDCHAMRPIHKHMSVAPPWARMRIVRSK